MQRPRRRGMSLGELSPRDLSAALRLEHDWSRGSVEDMWIHWSHAVEHGMCDAADIPAFVQDRRPFLGHGRCIVEETTVSPPTCRFFREEDPDCP